MKVKAIVLVLLFLIMSCVMWTSRTPPTGIRVACVGDSITYGAWFFNKSKAYPVYLQTLLGEKYHVENLGVNGATMLKNGNYTYWNRSKMKTALAFNPDIVIIKLGTNDSQKANWDSHGNEYISDFKEMIDKFRALPSRPLIYVCLPARAFKTMWGIREDILSCCLRPAIKRVAADNAVSLIDVYDATKDLSEHFPDGIHPDKSVTPIIAARVNKIITHPRLAIELAGNTLSAPAGYGHQWYHNGVVIPENNGGKAKDFKITAPGEYRVGVKLFAESDDTLISEKLTVSL